MNFLSNLLCKFNPSTVVIYVLLVISAWCRSKNKDLSLVQRLVSALHWVSFEPRVGGDLA